MPSFREYTLAIRELSIRAIWVGSFLALSRAASSTVTLLMSSLLARVPSCLVVFHSPCGSLTGLM